MNHQDDYQIVKEICAGDIQQYAILVKRYERLVFSLALRMMTNREDAQEVAQDVFVKVYQKLDSFKGEAKFSSWLYRITYNRSLDMLKKKKREPHVENIALAATINYNLVENVLDRMEQSAQQELIKQSIDKLVAEDAFIISLYYYDEHTIAEIAEITSLTESNVKIKLHRSRKKLFTLLQATPAFNKNELL